MAKIKSESPRNSAEAIAHALVEIFSPLLDEPRDETSTAPVPEETDRNFHYNFDSVIGAVHKRYQNAEAFEAQTQLAYQKRLETDPDEQDIRTSNASIYATRAGNAWLAALQLRNAFDEAYERLTGTCFEFETWQKNMEAFYTGGTKPNAAKAKANSAAEELAKRKAAMGL